MASRPLTVPLLSAAKPIEKTITFVSGLRAAPNLSVTLEYLPPEVLEEKANVKKEEMLGKLRNDALADPRQMGKAQQELVYALLASRVKKITLPEEDDGSRKPITVKVLSQLVYLTAEQIGQQGGFDSVLAFNTEDETPLEDPDADYKTVADVAAYNVLFLVKQCPRFREWLEIVVTDVSNFQDDDWAVRVKNLLGGGTPVAA